LVAVSVADDEVDEVGVVSTVIADLSAALADLSAALVVVVEEVVVMDEDEEVVEEVEEVEEEVSTCVASSTCGWPRWSGLLGVAATRSFQWRTMVFFCEEARRQSSFARRRRLYSMT